MFFPQEIIDLVWDKATKVEHYDSDMYRKDACGAWIRRDMYGRQDSPLGWEIDHIYPQALGGDEHLDNLRALQHQNNASKGDDYPSYEAVVVAQGNENVEQRQSFVVNAAKRSILSQIYHTEC